MQSDAMVQFRWEGFEQSDPDADAAASRVVESGGEAQIPPPREPGFAFIPIVLGAIAIVGLAKAVKSFVDDLGKGVVVDVRTDPVTIRKDGKLPSGVVLVIDKDGETKLEQPDHESLADIIAAAVKAKS